MRVLRGAAVAEASRWLRGRAGAWATVGGVVGLGFEAYARILHPVPARRLSWDDPGTGMVPRVVEEREWSWAEVAAAVGGVMHPLVQWYALTGDDEVVQLDDGWEVGQTRDGWLDPRLWAALVPHLLPHPRPAGSAAPAEVTLGIWSGWGELHPGGRHVVVATRGDDAAAGVVPDLPRLSPDVVEAIARGDVADVPGFEGTGREYLMLAGRLSELADPDWGFEAGIGWWGSFREPAPQFAWPADRAWAVATEIDLDSTLVAGSRALVDAVLADPVFEAFAVGPTDPVGLDGDTVNRSGPGVG
ncbi:hypothetical protein QQX09_10420 [Demequina sp. SYSU T00192]|uniref:DUF317 domain-containing protein n=1 Tax=Demequina litoralis TaxID=3051660 RepID=A0ABT8GC75_9MICO|nr:hypothetical protein [Demequina sp. SYSU T00192]MDN4476269.1 hypothetical protein [Demequina sp. SYSU T00192]